jgi:hypothetical protein
MPLCRRGGRPTVLLLRQKKVGKEKATLVSASLRFATGNLRCSGQPGSRSNSPAAQTIAGPNPSGPALLGAFTRVGGIGSGTDSDQSGLCVATIFIAASARISWARGQNYFTTRRAAGVFGVRSRFRCAAPAGRDEGAANSGSDPQNARIRIPTDFNPHAVWQG